jgi:hypothetical protein
MTVQMTNEARTAARSLAVSYDAFNECRAAENHNGVSVWGMRLLEVQADTGIELYAPDHIEQMIAHARAARHAAA